MYSKLEKMFYEQFYKKNGIFLIFFDIVFKPKSNLTGEFC